MAVDPNLISLFKAAPFTGLGGKNPGGLAPFLQPQAGQGAIDVINNYRWTLTPKEGRTETPKVRLTEYRLLNAALETATRYYAYGLAQQASIGPGNDTSWFRNAFSFLQSVTTGNNDANSNGSSYIRQGEYGAPYAGLFDFENDTGFVYEFPYFSEINTDLTNTWTSLDTLDKIQEAAGSLSTQLRQGLDLLLKGAGFAYSANYPRVGVVDRPKLWESSSPRTINIRFPLFNTYDHTDTYKNWQLCYLLMYQNMFNKRDFLTSVPPVFYSVLIPGQYFTIAAYVSNLQIRNRGNMRLVNCGGVKRNIPDVFEIDMTLTDMVTPSQNMHTVLLDNIPINVKNINKLTPSTEYNTTPGTTTYNYNSFPGGGNPIQFTPFNDRVAAVNNANTSPSTGGSSTSNNGGLSFSGTNNGLDPFGKPLAPD